MMSCQLIPMWHEWNVKANDVSMMWFALYANPSDIMSGMDDALCMLGTHALCKTSISK